jgi:hypothetical protein
MDFSWGGEALGARTHGGQDPPHRAGGSANGSTASGGGVPTMPASSRSRPAGLEQDASVEQESRAEQGTRKGPRTIDGKEVASSVPIPQWGVLVDL